MLEGCTSMREAALAIQYPAEAAMSPMDTMTGFVSAVSRISRVIISAAMGSPPGLSTRITTARMVESLLYFLSCAA